MFLDYFFDLCLALVTAVLCFTNKRTGIMLLRSSKAALRLSRTKPLSDGMLDVVRGREIHVFPRRSWCAATANVSPAEFCNPSTSTLPGKSVVNLDKLFWSKPYSLALAPDSPHRIEHPQYTGLRRFILKLMLYYSNQSKSIRGANIVYHRIVSQVDKPIIYEVFNLEPTFKMKFSLLVLHMWLFLRRIKEEGKEGAKFGQYLYEIYNHDVEMRVSKAGVNLLLTKWMKELEKIFYGNVIAYDTALLPEAEKDGLQKVLWRNVLSDDGKSEPDDVALRTAQAMARYVRREVASLSLTEKEDLFSGNFKFSSLSSA